MRSKFSLLIAAVLVFSGIFFFNSCRKNVKEAPDYSQSQNDLIEGFRQKQKNEPPNPVEILNLKGKGYYGDMNGNKIAVPPRVPGVTTDASTCLAPADSESDFTFVSMEREFTCGVGYRFTVTYKINSEFYLTNGTTSSPSGGRVRLRNATSTIYTTPLAALISLSPPTVVGTNSYGDDINEFIAVYRTDYVSEANYNSATSIQPNATIYTDCNLYPTFNIPFSPQQSAIGSQHTTQPCLRIDKVSWQVSSGLGASTAGCDAVPGNCFPSGYVFPDVHEIQIYANGAWQAINLWRWNNTLPPPYKEYRTGNGKITPWDIWYISMTDYLGTPSTIPNGTYPVRYRNKQTSGNGFPCSTQPDGGDGTWVTENWYISI